MLKLIGKYLRAGAMLNGVAIKSMEGTPQGGPVTPRTQKVTSNLNAGPAFRRGNRVRIDYCPYRVVRLWHTPRAGETQKAERLNRARVLLLHVDQLYDAVD